MLSIDLQKINEPRSVFLWGVYLFTRYIASLILFRGSYLIAVTGYFVLQVACCRFFFNVIAVTLSMQWTCAPLALRNVIGCYLDLCL